MKLPTYHISEFLKDPTNLRYTGGTFTSREDVLNVLKNNEDFRNVRITGNGDGTIFIWETVENKRIASMRFNQNDLREIINLIKSESQEHQNKTHVSVLTWNIGTQWKDSASYEGSWLFQDVIKLIDSVEPAIILLQEVPIREKSLGLHYYYDQLADCLRTWGWEIYSADRGMLKLVTAIHKDSGIEIVAEQVEPEENRKNLFPSWHRLMAERGKDEKNTFWIVNCHLKAGKDSDTQKNTMMEAIRGEKAIIGGDFNFHINREDKKNSGRVLSENGTVEDGDNLDAVLLKTTVDEKTVDEIIKDTPENKISDLEPSLPPRKETKDGSHYHLPVILNNIPSVFFKTT